MLALCVAAATSYGCAPSADRAPAELEVRLRTEPNPPAVGGTQLLVTVTDLGWRPINRATVSVKGGPVDNRTDPISASAEGRGAGQYLVSGIDFSTPGIWRLTLRVELPGGLWKEIERTLDVGPAQDTSSSGPGGA